MKHEEGPDPAPATAVNTKDVKKIDNLMQEALLGRTIPEPTDDDSAERAAQQASEQPPPELTAPAADQEPTGPLRAIEDLAAQLERVATATTNALLPSTQHSTQVRASLSSCMRPHWHPVPACPPSTWLP